MTGFRRGLQDSGPIAAGYVPIAFAFGAAAVQAGFSPWLAVLTSAVVFAGGSQFVLISLLAAGGTVFSVAATVLLINSRHLLYGGAIGQLLASQPSTASPCLLAFGLTDEVFASAVSRWEAIAPEQRQPWLVGLQTGAYAAWLAGTVFGSLLGADLLARFPALSSGFSFVLPAFFFSLLLGMKGRALCLPTGVGAFGTLALLPLLPAPAALMLGILGGAASGLWSTPRR